MSATITQPGAVPYCRTCGRLTYLDGGRRYCAHCEGDRAQRQEEAARVRAQGYAALQAQFRAHLAGGTWDREAWMAAHRQAMGGW